MDAGRTLALLVMSEERRLSLLEHLEACGIVVLAVGDCGEARRTLQSNPQVDVILTDLALSDGNWTDLLAAAIRCHSRAETVICMGVTDSRLWIDDLEGGAYDVLVEPYQKEDVNRIVEAAVARSRIPPSSLWQNSLPCGRGSASR